MDLLDAFVLRHEEDFAKDVWPHRRRMVVRVGTLASERSEVYPRGIRFGVKGGGSFLFL